jgi:hypothetical protein
MLWEACWGQAQHTRFGRAERTRIPNEPESEFVTRRDPKIDSFPKFRVCPCIQRADQ